MAGVYKVAYAKQHVVEKLYVFIGSRLVDKQDIDIQSLFNLEPNNALFDGVFDESEIDAISKDNTERMKCRRILNKTHKVVRYRSLNRTNLQVPFSSLR